MLVKFESVFGSKFEQEAISIERNLHGPLDHVRLNQEDFVDGIAIDMQNVIQFSGGEVYLNDERKSCTFVRFPDGSWSRNLLISFNEFSEMYEKATNNKVASPSDYIDHDPY